MEKDLFKRIDENYNKMSKGQKALACYLKKSLDKAVGKKAKTLANDAGVSEPTVVRFAAFLGYDGYKQLSEAIEELALNQMNSVDRLRMTAERLDRADVLTQTLNSDIEKIRQTLGTIDQETFDGAVDAICRARKIYIAGIRSSAPLASFLYSYLSLMCEEVILLGSGTTGEMYEQMIHIDLRDVIIAMSFPRYSMGTIRAVDFAKRERARVIAITDSEKAPISSQSDFCLVAKSDMASIVDSLVAPLSLINALIVAVSMQKGDEVAENMRKLEGFYSKYDFYEEN